MSVSIEDSLLKNGEARRRIRSKNEKKNPWKVLNEEWHEAVWRVFGKEVKQRPWGPAERSLAKSLIEEVGLDKSVEMARRFVEWWAGKGKEGVPSIKYFWTVRDSIRAVVDGTTKGSLAERRRKEREYDSANDGVEGWGDIFDG